MVHRKLNQNGNVNGTDRKLVKKITESPKTEGVKTTTALQVIPASEMQITQKKIISALNKLEVIQRHNLSEYDVKVVCEIVKEYKTDLNTVTKILDNGLDVFDLKNIMEVKRFCDESAVLISLDSKKVRESNTSKVPIYKIVALHKEFGSGPFDINVTMGQLDTLKSVRRGMYLTNLIDMVIEIKRGAAVHSFDYACDLLKCKLSGEGLIPVNEFNFFYGGDDGKETEETSNELL